VKVLIIKMSSLGDVIHCLPAVRDLFEHDPSIILDWVVEEGFADLPRMHPGVRRVLPIAIRRWRKSWLGHRREIMEFRQILQAERYDLVIDAQGLIKSAAVGRMAKGKLVGFDRTSVKEPIASMVYQQGYCVSRDLHAVQRLRGLFAQAIGYQISEDYHYGIERQDSTSSKDIYFFHGTTWASKHWPEDYWVALARICQDQGYAVVLPHLGGEERARAEKIAAAIDNARLLPPGTLSELSSDLASAAGAVSVDTGLGHLAAALDIPLVGIYGSTSHHLTGIVGPRQVSMSDTSLDCAPCLKRTCQYPSESGTIFPPCFEFVTPSRVFQKLSQQMMVGQ
tara:strand:+ start:3677 stop:4690 length:1014 start_codon:yes stop_codon:yes gene_type:complete